MTCVKSPTHGIEINVSHSECFGARPETTRACSLEACFKEFFSVPSIVVDNSTFLQTQRMKKVYLNVGGKAILLPKQPVKIRCVVKNMDSRLIFWTKDDRLISVSPYKRVHVTPKGVLKIKRTDPNIDKGTFTCMAGIEKASTYITFQTKKKAVKVAKSMMKHVLQEVPSLDKPQSDKIPGSHDHLRSLGGNSSTLAEYMVSDWSACSRSCGAGVQTREVTCGVFSDKFIKIVSVKHCEHQKKPVNIKTCLLQDFCPQWDVDKWGEVNLFLNLNTTHCSDVKYVLMFLFLLFRSNTFVLFQCSVKTCKKVGKAVQRRAVYCTNGNGTVIRRSKCQNVPVPTGSRECDNADCKVEWITSKWTKVSGDDKYSNLSQLMSENKI